MAINAIKRHLKQYTDSKHRSSARIIYSIGYKQIQLLESVYTIVNTFIDSKEVTRSIPYRGIHLYPIGVYPTAAG
jgi:hypothetical protein